MSRPTIDQQITFIYVSDLMKSADFYENTLGLSLWRDQKTCRIYHVVGSSYVGICQSSDESKGRIEAPPQNLILTIVSDDVDGWYQALSTAGVSFEHPPQINPKYNIYHCFLRDPDGYLIEIQRFLHNPIRGQ